MMAMLRILSIEGTLPEVGSRQHYDRRQWSQIRVTQCAKNLTLEIGLALEQAGHLPQTFGLTPQLITALRYKVGSRAVVCSAGSAHFPCSRIRSFRRSTASASGMLNFTAVLPT